MVFRLVSVLEFVASPVCDDVESRRKAAANGGSSLLWTELAPEEFGELVGCLAPQWLGVNQCAVHIPEDGGWLGLTQTLVAPVVLRRLPRLPRQLEIPGP